VADIEDQNNMKKTVRVVVAEDDPLSMEQIVRLIETHFDIIERAENGHELLTAVHRLSPTVVVTDINMPGIDGIEATRFIAANYPSVKVVVLSVEDDPAVVEAVFDAGASAYVSKYVAHYELLPAIENVLGGRQYRATGPRWTS
jgi:DNA-binding NarL/FixJ family response regulator